MSLQLRGRSIARLGAILLVGIGLIGCSHTQRMPSLMETRGLVEDGGLPLDRYFVTGGAWVGESRLMVNHDYDFSLALGVSGSGPAIAAGRRIAANREVAGELAALDLPEASTLVSEGAERLDGDRCREDLDLAKVHWAALLFGVDQTQLAVAITAARTEGQQAAHPATSVVAFSDVRPLHGQAGWLAEDGAAIRAALATQSAQALRVFGCASKPLPEKSGGEHVARVFSKEKPVAEWNGCALPANGASSLACVLPVGERNAVYVLPVDAVEARTPTQEPPGTDSRQGDT